MDTQKALDEINQVRSKWQAWAALHAKPAWFIYGALTATALVKAFW